MLTDEHVDLFSKPVVTPVVARGLTEDGWVRTTGWLQVGDHPVSSSHIAAVVGLLWASVGAAVLVGTYPVVAGVLVLTVPALCGGSWWLFTARVRPASMARNIDTTTADELMPGDLVRLYGSIGPVGQVVAVTYDEDVLVTFQGGAHQTWARGHVVHLVELLT
ncbi:hypothetical protein LFM09_06475 [Lentzea alba]|uniref:hypothetical protein n=1 Tax=Lentzea alba TaxID=2714351 RepID=UPI0039BF7B16